MNEKQEKTAANSTNAATNENDQIPANTNTNEQNNANPTTPAKKQTSSEFNAKKVKYHTEKTEVNANTTHKNSIDVSLKGIHANATTTTKVSPEQQEQSSKKISIGSKISAEKTTTESNLNQGKITSQSTEKTTITVKPDVKKLKNSTLSVNFEETNTNANKSSDNTKITGSINRHEVKAGLSHSTTDANGKGQSESISIFANRNNTFGATITEQRKSSDNNSTTYSLGGSFNPKEHKTGLTASAESKQDGNTIKVTGEFGRQQGITTESVRLDGAFRLTPEVLVGGTINAQNTPGQKPTVDWSVMAKANTGNVILNASFSKNQDQNTFKASVTDKRKLHILGSGQSVNGVLDYELMNKNNNNRSEKFRIGVQQQNGTGVGLFYQRNKNEGSSNTSRSRFGVELFKNQGSENKINPAIEQVTPELKPRQPLQVMQETAPESSQTVAAQAPKPVADVLASVMQSNTNNVAPTQEPSKGYAQS